ncbi:hypothetical protein KIPB_005984 [Kipferlia bialata]|uniref:Uncharacterized protein n=1 Tax=Kipferlia bialata TaxID=797122 RepID=A0A9K3CXW0_9EUKA|nr:hypothetical protein KIPB_005984 [Kipferlia bialata]|eukprot:g5984.t1
MAQLEAQRKEELKTMQERLSMYHTATRSLRMLMDQLRQDQAVKVVEDLRSRLEHSQHQVAAVSKRNGELVKEAAEMQAGHASAKTDLDRAKQSVKNLRQKLDSEIESRQFCRYCSAKITTKLDQSGKNMYNKLLRLRSVTMAITQTTHRSVEEAVQETLQEYDDTDKTVPHETDKGVLDLVQFGRRLAGVEKRLALAPTVFKMQSLLDSRQQEVARLEKVEEAHAKLQRLYKRLVVESQQSSVQHGHRGMSRSALDSGYVGGGGRDRRATHLPEGEAPSIVYLFPPQETPPPASAAASPMVPSASVGSSSKTLSTRAKAPFAPGECPGVAWVTCVGR